jgi:hypothetical protein
MAKILQSSYKKWLINICSFVLGLICYDTFKNGFPLHDLIYYGIVAFVLVVISFPIFNYLEKRKNTKMGIKGS